MIEGLELLKTFVYSYLPWITYTVFLAGISIRIYSWFSLSRLERRHAFFEPISATSGFTAVLRFVYMLIFQGHLIKRNAKSLFLWVTSASAHISLFLILFGHLRPIGVWSASMFAWLAPEQFLVKELPFYLGWVVLGGFTILLIRRLVDRSVRSISGFDDYFLLAVLITIFLAGNMMRVSPYVHEPFSLYIAPGMVMQLSEQPSLTWLIIHGLAAQILVMYLPFSKLIHIIASPFTVIAYSIRHARLYRGVSL